MNSNINLIDDIETIAKTNQHRYLVILSGPHDWCIELLNTYRKKDQQNDQLFISDNTTIPNVVPIKKAIHCLGQEFSSLAYDMYSGFDPDVFSAVSGTLCGGGLLFIIAPPLHLLPDSNDPYLARIANWPYIGKQLHTRYLRRLVSKFKQHKDVFIIENLSNPSEDHKLDLDTHLESNTLFQSNSHPACKTKDQELAVIAIKHVLSGHRNRPLVISSDRGRGKTSALGIAIAELFSQGNQQIIVTAPSLNAVMPLFKHAQALLDHSNLCNGVLSYQESYVQFKSPDELCHKQYSCSLLLVDEAAAIPTPILADLLKKHSRIVFSTTVHGYEGTGRGFQLRFHRILDKITPQWQQIQLNTPIRWNEQDPLERFIFDSMLLDAQAVEDKLIENANLTNCHFEHIERDNLINNEKSLTELFGLLVLAHYQTRPSDLRYLLDALDLDIYALKYEDHIIAVAFVAIEGSLNAEIAESVYQNERRIQGHLLAQTMEMSVGIPQVSTLSFARIIRIAVHPAKQNSGLGSLLLNKIELSPQNEQLDFIGAVYASNTQLLNFWNKQHYQPIHLGHRRNASSGSHSVTVIKAFSKRARLIENAAQNKFANNFPAQLAESFQDLETDIVMQLLLSCPTCDQLEINEEEQQDILSFANTLRPYEANINAIWKLLLLAFSQITPFTELNNVEQQILIIKVLQKKNWQNTATQLALAGKAPAIKLLRVAVKKLTDTITIGPG